jgi:hypothetical protein
VNVSTWIIIEALNMFIFHMSTRVSYLSRYLSKQKYMIVCDNSNKNNLNNCPSTWSAWHIVLVEHIIRGPIMHDVFFTWVDTPFQEQGHLSLFNPQGTPYLFITKLETMTRFFWWWNFPASFAHVYYVSSYWTYNLCCYSFSIWLGLPMVCESLSCTNLVGCWNC